MNSNLITQAMEQAVAMVAELEELRNLKAGHIEEIQTYKDTLDEHFIHYELLKADNEKLKAENHDHRQETPNLLSQIGNLQKELKGGWTDKKQGFISEFMDRSESWGEYQSFMREYYPEDASDEEDEEETWVEKEIYKD